MAAPVEGALAPDPRLELENMEPLREIPGLRRPARTWKDEVRERVRQRKQQRSGGELPLFPEEDDDDAAAALSDVDRTDVDLPDDSGPSLAADPVAAALPGGEESRLTDLGDEPPMMVHARLRDLGAPDASAAGEDLALRPRDTRPFEMRMPPPAEIESPLDEELDDPLSERWAPVDRRPEGSAGVAALERPALAAERAQAAALDLGLLLGLWSVVVYFASRAAHVTVAGLLPSWPYLAGYLAALGLIYAGYFTGTTGQTLGKIAVGLRVVDAAGRPPGYPRALGRAVLGSLGVLAAGTGLVPIAFDPARRALHDRVLETRVVRL